MYISVFDGHRNSSNTININEHNNYINKDHSENHYYSSNDGIMECGWLLFSFPIWTTIQCLIVFNACLTQCLQWILKVDCFAFSYFKSIYWNEVMEFVCQTIKSCSFKWKVWTSNLRRVNMFSWLKYFICICFSRLIWIMSICVVSMKRSEEGCLFRAMSSPEK